MNRTGPTRVDGSSREGGDRSEYGAGGSRGWWWRTLAAAVALLLAVGLAWYVAEGYRQAGGRGSRAEGPPAGTERSGRRGPVGTRSTSGRSRWLEIRAPTVTFPTLDGDTASLAGLRGKVVVLNFWATWCPPCERELPELVRLQDSLRADRATVVGVAVSSGSREEIRAFSREHGVDYPVWLADAGTAATEYRAAGLPTTLLVDPRGVIRRRYMGPQRYGTLVEDVRAVLDSLGSPAPGQGAAPRTSASR